MTSLFAAARGHLGDRLSRSFRRPSRRQRKLLGAEQLEAKVMLSAVIANDDSFGVLHNFPLEGEDVTGNDIDNSPFMEGLTASLISDVSQGTLILDPSGTFQYTPSGTYVGVDTFVYEVSNSYGSDQATVTINVGNIAPVADDLTFDVPHSTTLSDVAVSAYDENGGTRSRSRSTAA